MGLRVPLGADFHLLRRRASPACPAGWGWWFAAFAVFRFFDIVKIWPASWIDKRLKTGFGVMLDDLFAALYAWAAIELALALYWRFYG